MDLGRYLLTTHALCSNGCKSGIDVVGPCFFRMTFGLCVAWPIPPSFTLAALLLAAKLLAAAKAIVTYVAWQDPWGLVQIWMDGCDETSATIRSKAGLRASGVAVDFLLESPGSTRYELPDCTEHRPTIEKRAWRRNAASKKQAGRQGQTGCETQQQAASSSTQTQTQTQDHTGEDATRTVDCGQSPPHLFRAMQLGGPASQSHPTLGIAPPRVLAFFSIPLFMMPSTAGDSLLGQPSQPKGNGRLFGTSIANIAQKLARAN
ncbi:hypothetical protein PG990_015353 [Apiospora arundinis]